MYIYLITRYDENIILVKRDQGQKALYSTCIVIDVSKGLLHYLISTSLKSID